MERGEFIQAENKEGAVLPGQLPFISNMKLTKDQITQDALKILRAAGHRVRKVHNVSAYKKRKGQVEPGWPDIQGYSSKGIVTLCEVKAIGDHLSPVQVARLRDCYNCGGFATIATDREGKTVFLDFKPLKY